MPRARCAPDPACGDTDGGLRTLDSPPGDPVGQRRRPDHRDRHRPSGKLGSQEVGGLVALRSLLVARGAEQGGGGGRGRAGDSQPGRLDPLRAVEPDRLDPAGETFRSLAHVRFDVGQDALRATLAVQVVGIACEQKRGADSGRYSD
jgi:hypothetical protein